MTVASDKTFFLKKSTGKEPIEISRILNLLKSISSDLTISEDLLMDLYNKIIEGLCDNMLIDELFSLFTECAASCMTKHPDFDVISRRLAVKQLHAKTGTSFFKKVKLLFKAGLYFDKSFYERVKEAKDEIEAVIDYNKDFNLSYFGIRTLERSYLLKLNDKIIERPQDLYMRVALGVHYDSLQDAFETYRLLSTQYFSFATPTMFNSGTMNQQMASCFLLGIDFDTTESIFDAVKNCALISKRTGGLGLQIHNLRGNNSIIKSSGGRTSGIVPVLKIFESTLRCIDQGGQKRPGACAFYLEPWHVDILEFIELKKNTGKEEMRCRDLFTALWIPDLFMERVKEDGQWSLFSPDEVPGLNLLYGEEFKEKYIQEEKKGTARRTIRAQVIWKSLISSQIETGLPYMLYKDTINKCNNQKHLGTIQSSNLCAEIVEYTSPDEIAVCNLSSIGLPSFLVKKGMDAKKYHQERMGHNNSPDGTSDTLITPESPTTDSSSHSISQEPEKEEKENFDGSENKRMKTDEKMVNKSVETITQTVDFIFTTDESEYYFDFNHLRYVVSIIIHSMNKIIDINAYPLSQARNSNFKHRPLGLGIQGLADLFVMLRLPFDSDKARELNKLIFETIQFAALEESCKLAKQYGPYSSFEGSPASKGILHFDFYGVKPITPFDWSNLRRNIVNYGLRNSMLTSLMPTASTSQIMGFNECFEPFTSNFYARRTLAGDFQIINKYLLKDLIQLGLWNDEMKNILIEQKGSIQKITSIPKNLKQLYKTSWELSMKSLIDLSSDRQPFIDQSQSLNMFVATPTYQKITSMHFYSWKKKLKTGMYYLRTKPIASAVQFTVDKEMIKKSNLMTSDLQFSEMNTGTYQTEDENGPCDTCTA
ncbi:ribonucleoside-diphosphate reductase, alpha subunit [Pseudoloma neurophilia]|uniref:Ribonucleoside-diphosphate reductase n=1 Tax=Pseudoloma neurophilia TaxID=146866 RepID=A0A0R0M2L3_9MICR|nr:ribonucleoside-diphosphate reductase, alpha subunit [Pseudoloma neurophilia]